MKLIGIAGRAGSGKDTVADLLIEKYQFRKYAFADPIKLGLQSMFGLNRTHFEDRERKEAPIVRLGNKSPRQLMQLLGTEFGRELVDENLWIGLADSFYRELDAQVQSSFGDSVVRGIVIPDVRFENEARWIRSHGGFIVHLVRPDLVAVHAHSSERGVSYARNKDFVMMNDGSIARLEEEVDTMMQEAPCAA